MEKSEAKKRIVLVPLPAQGHITPMLQLGKALNLKGFSITVVQGHFNQVRSSSHHFPGFQVITKLESLSESELERLGPTEFLMKLNKTSEASFKDCIAQLLVQQGNDLACIVYDELMFFCGAAAKEFNLPSFIFSTTSAIHKACCSVLTKLNARKFLIDMEDPEMQHNVVENLHPLRYKDLPISGTEPLEQLVELCKEVLNNRTASAVIINAASCLENSTLSWLQQELGIPVYPLGPLHITASLNSSLVEEDKNCIEWLNKQKLRSVLYISMGSIYDMETKEVLEMAWGLCDSNQPFLWVVRSGSITGLESFPEELSKMISKRGYIVKWDHRQKYLRITQWEASGATVDGTQRLRAWWKESQ